MSLIYEINSGRKYTAPPKPDRFSYAAPQPTTASLEEVPEEDETEETTENLNQLDIQEEEKLKEEKKSEAKMIKSHREEMIYKSKSNMKKHKEKNNYKNKIASVMFVPFTCSAPFGLI